jgi:hypothetical protein
LGFSGGRSVERHVATVEGSRGGETSGKDSEKSGSQHSMGWSLGGLKIVGTARRAQNQQEGKKRERRKR